MIEPSPMAPKGEIETDLPPGYLRLILDSYDRLLTELRASLVVAVAERGVWADQAFALAKEITVLTHRVDALFEWHQKWIKAEFRKKKAAPKKKAKR